MIEPNISSASAAESIWDAIVIGAGPAGSITATSLARGGWSVLLLDSKTFPRDKVCGGCVNSRALSVLASIGLNGAFERVPSIRLKEYAFHLRRRQFDLPSTSGIAISRSVFDAFLVEAAIHSGVRFCSGASGKLLPSSEYDAAFRVVEIEETGKKSASVRGRTIVIADGLSRSSLRLTDEFPSTVAKDSWIGLHATYPASLDSMRSGLVRMAIARGGYVGAVMTDDQTVNLAAAVSPAELRTTRIPASVISKILTSAGVPAPNGIESFGWQGTGPLTRNSSVVGAGRVYLVGDSAGYVEPFTGEGIAHALTGGAALAGILLKSNGQWNPSIAEAWNKWYRREIGGRHWLCRTLASALHQPFLADSVFGVATWFPTIPRWIVHRLNAPYSGVSPS